MGRGSAVKPHGRGIQVSFTWNGKTHRPTLRIPPTPANLRYAEKMVAEVRERIRLGSFDFSHYFPDATKAAGHVVAQAHTFKERADAWHAGLTDLEHSTLLGYRRILDHYWIPAFGDRDIAAIRNSDIRTHLAALPIGRKTRNNILIPARAVFDQAVVDEIVQSNPMELIKNSKVQKEPPDPLELEEIGLALAAVMTCGYPEPVLNYFEFALFTGLRPSEQIALRWPDVDWKRGTVSVRRATVWKVDKPRTKTHLVRDVELTTRALAALQRQKAHTLLAGGLIFLNPHTGKEWSGLEHQRRLWGRVLAAAKVRYREPYQCRHTFATQAIMAGANPAWIARQLGHANMGMLLKVYGKWIDAADRSRERAKLDAAFCTNPAQKATSTGTSE